MKGREGFKLTPPGPTTPPPPPTDERLSSKVPALLGSCYDSTGQLDLANWLMKHLAALVTFFQIRGRRKISVRSSHRSIFDRNQLLLLS